MKMKNSIEKSSSLNCSLFSERERGRGPVQPIKLSTEKTTKQSTKKKGGGLHFRLFVVKMESICKAMRKGCGKDNVCVPINPSNETRRKEKIRRRILVFDRCSWIFNVKVVL